MEYFRSFIFLIFFSGLTCFNVLYAQQIPAGTDGFPNPADGTMENFSYTCPMHSDVVLDAPGNCYKCGMNLNQQETKSKPGEKAKVYFACQDHSETRFNKKGKCQVCGRKLKKYKIFSYE